MTKEQLRTLYREMRNQLSIAQRNKARDLILIQIQQFAFPPLHYVHAYRHIAARNEVDTENIIRYFEFINPGLERVIPRIDDEGQQLIHILQEENTVMEMNKYGFEEPVSGKRIVEEEIDLVLIPLLAFDSLGYRVGYGKGYYDKFLSRCRPDTIKMGLSYFEAVSPITDTSNFDVPLTHCVTPHRMYEF